MAEIDMDVRDWFCRICREFADLRLIVIDSGQKESIAFEFPMEWRGLFGNKQVATVQYMGATSKKPLAYENVEVRFYREPLQRAGLWDIVEQAGATSAKVMKENGKNTYCAYKLPEEYFYDRYVGPILEKIAKSLMIRPELKLEELPVCEIPQSIYELPRQ